MKSRIMLLPLLSLGLAACAQKGPACSDEQTIGLVKKAFYATVTDEAKKYRFDAATVEKIIRKVQLSLTTIRTAAVEEKVKKYLCEAQLEMKLTPDAAAVVNNPMIRAAVQEDNLFESIHTYPDRMVADVNYEAQLTDDQSSIHLTLKGHRGLASALVAVEWLNAVTGKNAVMGNQADSAGKSLLAAKPETLAGLHPYDLFKKEPDLEARLKAMLENDYERLLQRLDVSSGVAIEGDYLLADGHAPHMADDEEAALSVHLTKGQVHALILSNGRMEIIGARNGKELPPPLYRWYKERGGQD